MKAYRQAEWLKHKRRFNRKIIWIAPLTTVLLALVLMGGRYLHQGAFNWWYIFLLPGSMTMLAAFMVGKEKQKNRHGMLALAEHKSKLWIAQVEVGTILLFMMCMLFGAMLTCAEAGIAQCIMIESDFKMERNIIMEQGVLVGRNIFACVVIFITVAWQIPLWMFVTEKAGIFVTMFISLVANIGCQIICAEESYWWIPFAIPARLMCTVIKVLPNGLQVEEGSYLMNQDVILPGIVITMSLWAIGTVVTCKWFERTAVV